MNYTIEVSKKDSIITVTITCNECGEQLGVAVQMAEGKPGTKPHDCGLNCHTLNMIKEMAYTYTAQMRNSKIHSVACNAVRDEAIGESPMPWALKPRGPY